MEEEQNVKTSTSVQVVTAIVEKIGIKKSFKYLSELDTDEVTINSNNDSSKKTRYQTFLDKIIRAGLITKDQINQLIAEGGVKLPSPTFGGLDSNPSTITALKRNSSSPFQTGTTAMKSPLVDDAVKRFGSRTNTTIHHNRARSNIEGDLTPGLKHKEMKFGYNDILEDGNTPPSSIQKHEFMESYNFDKSSHDVSELAVSSYSSVSSGYLKDYSWNEDGNSFNQKKTPATKLKKRASTISRNRTSSFNFKYDSPRETVGSVENKSSNKKIPRFMNDLSMNSNRSGSFSEALN